MKSIQPNGDREEKTVIPIIKVNHIETYAITKNFVVLR